MSIDRSLLSATLFPLQDAGLIAAVSRGAGRERQGCLRPEQLGEETHAIGTGQTLCHENAQQRRGAGLAFAVALVNAWVESEPSPPAASAASRRFGRLRFLDRHQSFDHSIGSGWQLWLAVQLSSDGAATAPI